MNMDYVSKYSFIRTELRVLQHTCGGDNEKFLNYLADSIGKLEEKVEALKTELIMVKQMQSED